MFPLPFLPDITPNPPEETSLTLSKTDRAVLHEIAAELLTMTTLDLEEVSNLADRIQHIADGGNAELGNLLWAANWAVGDIGANDDNELQDDIDLALQAITEVLDYRAERERKPRAAAPRNAVEFVTMPDGTMRGYL